MNTTPTEPGKSAAANDAEQALMDAQAAPVKPRKLRDPQLAVELFELQQKNRWSDAKLARMMGTNPSYIVRYRKDEFPGDLDAFETAARVLMSKRLLLDETVNVSREGYCVETVHAFLHYLEEQGQMGVGYGPAGRGKTIAAKLYASENPTVVYVHLWDWTASKHLMQREIANAAGIKRWSKNDANLGDVLNRWFKGAKRLIVIDNAHEITPSGRRWLADFYDATGTAIALIGNPEIVGKFAANDQQASRMGRCIDVTPIQDTQTTVMDSIRQHFPEALADVEVQRATLEELTIPGSGANRRTKRLLRIAASLHKADPRLAPAKAFLLAKTQLPPVGLAA